MAEPKAETSEIDTLAFELFSARVAGNQIRRGGEQEAVDSYRKAEAFLKVRAAVRRGEIKPIAAPTVGPELADCAAPNLPRTHPYNLVARNYTDRKSGGTQMPGDLAKVNRIKRWLDVNPTPESDPEDLVPRINHEFPELSWDLPTINTARVVFPAYCKT